SLPVRSGNANRAARALKPCRRSDKTSKRIQETDRRQADIVKRRSLLPPSRLEYSRFRPNNQKYFPACPWLILVAPLSSCQEQDVEYLHLSAPSPASGHCPPIIHHSSIGRQSSHTTRIDG
ncbi:unnamed protein product, partial [Ectocarpus sp. 12 AP-2014]